MNCQICDAVEGKVHKAREMMFGTREEFRYFECGSCGCLQLMDVPDDLGRHYPSDKYYSLTQYVRAEKHGNPLLAYVFDRRNKAQAWNRGGLWGWVAKKRPAREIAEYALVLPDFLDLPPVRKHGLDTRVLDVGCGVGMFLHALGMAGFRHLEGIDPFSKDITYPHLNIRIRAQSAEQIAEAGGGTNELQEGGKQGREQYDVITFNHSLEHMPDMMRALAAARRLLAKDGVCLVDVPVVESEAWERYGVNWVDLDAPRHLFLHTERSMGIAARKAGLRITRTSHMNVAHSFYASEMYRRDFSLYEENSAQARDVSAILTPDEMAAFEAQSAQAQARGAWARFLMTTCD